VEQAQEREAARVPEDHARRLVLEVEQVEPLAQVSVIVEIEHRSASVIVRDAGDGTPRQPPGPVGDATGGSGLVRVVSARAHDHSRPAAAGSRGRGGREANAAHALQI
jgi:hypothetical protein